MSNKFLAFSLLVAGTLLGEGKLPEDWMSRIRPEHPRIFLNRDNLASIKRNAESRDRSYYDAIVERVNRAPDNPVRKWNPERFRQEPDGSYKFEPPYFTLTRVLEFIGGVQAMDAALLYHLSGEEKYLVKGKTWLKFSLETYLWALENQLMLEWEMTHYFGSIIAYDWLYPFLSEDERQEIIRPLLQLVSDLQDAKKARYRINRGGVDTGFYGVAQLPFLAGLAAYGDPVSHDLAAPMLEIGCREFMDVMDYRDKIAEADGVLVHSCLDYSLGEYPLASLVFFLALESTTGLQGAKIWRHLEKLPSFIFWNWIPGKELPLQFGLGDSHHLDNGFPLASLYCTLQFIRQFYNEENKETANLATALLCQREKVTSSMWFKYPFFAFLLHERELPEEFPAEAWLPQKKFHFMPTAGTAFMRSGNSSTDSYAVFRVGGKVTNHQHYDEGHFVIYKQGFLALDSGTRGLNRSFHLPYYYAQTIAHNAMLIRMPEEPIPAHWGPFHHIGDYPGEKPFCDGGQNKHIAGKPSVRDFADFAYVRNDASAAYAPEKCALAIREFLHLRPDIFLIIDKVTSTRPEYEKAFLLHTQEQPELLDAAFTVVHEEGRLTGQTLFPERPIIRRIGGPGQEFLASGRNWELHPVHDAKYVGKLHGNWRLEIVPPQPAEFNLMVNLLQVGQAKEELPPLDVNTKLQNGLLQINFNYQKRLWNLVIPNSPDGKMQVSISDPDISTFQTSLPE